MHRPAELEHVYSNHLGWQTQGPKQRQRRFRGGLGLAPSSLFQIRGRVPSQRAGIGLHYDPYHP